MKLAHFAIVIINRFPKTVLLSVVLMIIQGIVSGVALISVAPLIDLVLHPNGEGVSPLTEKLMEVAQSLGFSPTFLFFSLVFLIMILGKNIFLVAVTYGLLLVKWFLLLELGQETFESFFKARFLFFTDSSHGKLVNTFLREIMRSGDAFGQLGMMIAQINQIAIFVLVPFIVSWQMTLVCMTVAVVLASPLWLLGKLSYQLGIKNTSTSNTYTGVLKESIDGAKVIIGFGEQQQVLSRFLSAFNAHRVVTIAASVLDEGIRRCYEPLGIVALLVAIHVTNRGSFPIAETGVVVFALRGIIPIIGQITATRNLLLSFLPGVEQVEQLKIKALELKTPSGDILFEQLEFGIKFNDVSFSYGTEFPEIRNLTMDIPTGKLVGIVGKSGSGKSTLIDLLLGLNVVQNGCIEVDGTALEKYDLESYRKRIGYVPQDPVLFNMSIRDNLLWASPNATDDELWECCMVADVAEFVRSLPLQLDAEIGDRGIRLSGGQLQRLALARALIRKPELLLLDEATSALDTGSERLIQDAIEKSVGRRTIVVVAHRLSTIVNADYVYVVDEGRISEAGTYTELLMMNGLFSKMVRVQKLQPLGPV